MAKELRFLHSAFPLLTLYICVKFHSIPFYTFTRYSLDKLLLQKLKRGSYSVNTGDRFTVLASVILLIALYKCMKFH